jgi:hypothetical protein
MNVCKWALSADPAFLEKEGRARRRRRSRNRLRKRLLISGQKRNKSFAPMIFVQAHTAYNPPFWVVTKAGLLSKAINRRLRSSFGSIDPDSLHVLIIIEPSADMFEEVNRFHAAT